MGKIWQRYQREKSSLTWDSNPKPFIPQQLVQLTSHLTVMSPIFSVGIKLETPIPGDLKSPACSWGHPNPSRTCTFCWVASKSCLDYKRPQWQSTLCPFLFCCNSLPRTSTRWLNQHIQAFSTLLEVPLINLSNIKNCWEKLSEMQRIKPGAAGWVVQTLPLCYVALPPVSLSLSGKKSWLKADQK